MGMWNQTCMISQLPIQGGDPVRLLFLSGLDQHSGFDLGKFGSGTCYPNDIWAPRTLPLRGVYSSYGNAEEIEDNWNRKFIEHAFSYDLEERPESEGHPEITRSAATVENIQEWIHDSHVNVVYPMQNMEWMHQRTQNLAEGGEDRADVPREASPYIRPLGYALVLEEVYQHLVETTPPGWRSKSKDEERELLSHWAKNFTSNMAELPGTNRWPRPISGNQDPGGWLEGDRHRLDRFPGHLPTPWTENSDCGLVLEMGNLSHIDRPFEIGLELYLQYVLHLIRLGATIDDERIQAVLDEFAEFTVVRNHLLMLRKPYQPQAGQGSQSNGYQSHYALAQKAVEICERVRDVGEEDPTWRH